MCHDGMLDSIQFPIAESRSWYFRFIWIDRLMLRLTWCQSFCFYRDHFVQSVSFEWLLPRLGIRYYRTSVIFTSVWRKYDQRHARCSIILVHFAHFLCVPTHFSLNSVSIKPLIGFCLQIYVRDFFYISSDFNFFLLYSHRNRKFSVFTFVLI